MRLAIFTVFCIFFGCDRTTSSEINWSYYEEKYEILHPQISGDNTHLVFVRKLHSPDGHEAEMFSEDELKKYDERAKTNKRFEDPEIVLLNIKDKRIKKIDFGWNPSFSHDNEKIVYAHQAKPISGLRVLAATLAGNEIRQYDIGENRIQTLAQPDFGYFSGPVFNKDDKKVLFSIADAANGSYGSSIGVGEVDIATRKQKTIYEPSKEKGLYHLVEKFGIHNGRCIVMRKRLAHKGRFGNSYYHELVEATKNSAILYSWGKFATYDIETDFRIQPSGAIEVYHNRWKTISSSENVHTKTASTFGISSPDCTYIAVVKRQSVSILNSSSGESEAFWDTKNDKIQSVTWSPDSSQVLVVVTQYAGGLFGKFKHDKLLILKPTKHILDK